MSFYILALKAKIGIRYSRKAPHGYTEEGE
jgi:hypothetical protein